MFKSKFLSLIFVLSLSISYSTPAKADFMNYLSSCLMAGSGGLVGTAYASTKLPSDKKMTTTGYLMATAFSCIAGIAFTATESSDAKFEAESGLKKENVALDHHWRRLSKEKCLMARTCKVEGPAILVEGEEEVMKQGGQVYRTKTTTIEPNE
ncbi:MAG: hypothetical protein EOP06_09070 [Proteobacteria bacterium]|nr:MAG: hypothetical protein EOP06_09070 [Pseudomonadota bacterium]